jgi:hypothetical protein
MADNSLLPMTVENLIYLVRGHKVMLDEDLARLYDVETRILTRAVRRNADRFPPPRSHHCHNLSFAVGHRTFLSLGQAASAYKILLRGN